MELATLNAEINRRDLLVGAALAGGAAALAGAVQPAAARAD